MVGNVTGYRRSIVTVQSSWLTFSVEHDFGSEAYESTIENKRSGERQGKDERFIEEISARIHTEASEAAGEKCGGARHSLGGISRPWCFI
jgi:hypothetical protein